MQTGRRRSCALARPRSVDLGTLDSCMEQRIAQAGLVCVWALRFVGHIVRAHRGRPQHSSSALSLSTHAEHTSTQGTISMRRIDCRHLRIHRHPPDLCNPHHLDENDKACSHISKTVEFDTSHDYRGVTSHWEPVTLVLSSVGISIKVYIYVMHSLFFWGHKFLAFLF